jgi:SpoVK/Ycf46/Vps4 family AAA+-type ATPase
LGIVLIGLGFGGTTLKARPAEERTVAASGEHIKALVRSHAAGDDAAFYAVALQVAAKAARQGHRTLAGELKQANDVGEARRILNSFLIFLEQASAESIVIAATNHRSILDHALFRRFDVAIKYELPDAAQAAQVMRTRLGPLGRGIRWDSVNQHVSGLSHAELVKAAEMAAKQVILCGEQRVPAADLIDALQTRRMTSNE